MNHILFCVLHVQTNVGKKSNLVYFKIPPLNFVCEKDHSTEQSIISCYTICLESYPKNEIGQQCSSKFNLIANLIDFIPTCFKFNFENEAMNVPAKQLNEKTSFSSRERRSLQLTMVGAENANEPHHINSLQK